MPVKNWRDDLCAFQFLDSIPDGERRYIISPLLIVNDYVRRSPRRARFDLRANLLDLGGLLLELRGQSFHSFLQLRDSPLLFQRFAALFLHCAVLFEELVEQHRVHRLVPLTGRRAAYKLALR